MSVKVNEYMNLVEQVGRGVEKDKINVGMKERRTFS